jgi:acyl-CoA thioester hydrolase
MILDFPLQATDKLRFADTDRQGHINNSVFLTFLETGRVELLYDAGRGILSPDCSFVIASVKLDFVAEIRWPGEVNIGTGLQRIGNSSLGMYQEIYQNDLLVAKASTVIVQVHDNTKKSEPLSIIAREELQAFLLDT